MTFPANQKEVCHYFPIEFNNFHFLLCTAYTHLTLALPYSFIVSLIINLGETLRLKTSNISMIPKHNKNNHKNYYFEWRILSEMVRGKIKNSEWWLI